MPPRPGSIGGVEEEPTAGSTLRPAARRFDLVRWLARSCP
uniref:Uncharacterized protein n=1 Tax=Arundo donax TaxID=35708 RepID=A0A0A9AQ86_ARUDO